MLPQSSTSRYGDLLREFYAGLKDDTLSESRMDEIQRIFNELNERENVYRSWMDKNQIITAALAGHPFLKQTKFERIAAQTIPHDTETEIVFDDETDERLVTLDSEKLRLTTQGRDSMLGIGGTIQWAANATGRRAIHVNVYDSAGTLLFGQTMHSMPPTSALAPTLPFFSAVHIAKTLQVDYITITVIQTSGGDLDVDSVRMIVFEMET